MDKADEVFWKEFAVVLVLLTIFAVAMFFLARTIGGRAFERTLQTDRAIAERIAPVGQVRIGEPGATVQATVQPASTVASTAAAEPGEGPSGEEIYNGTCVACHSTGVAGAPKVGDKAAWEPRAATGLDALLNSVVNGKGAMPPKAGNPALTEPGIKNAIAFMLEKTGVSPGASAAQAPAASAAQSSAPSAEPVAAAAQASASAAESAAGDGRAGEVVYNTTCMACHATGVAGAPKLGDKAAWSPRLSAGVDALVTSVVNGKGAMPPKGGNATLSNGDIRNAVHYMVQKSQ